MQRAYALVDENNGIFIETVSASERAAMVNALVAIFRVPVFQQDSDLKIENMFHAKAVNGQRIKVVMVQPVDLM